MNNDNGSRQLSLFRLSFCTNGNYSFCSYFILLLHFINLWEIAKGSLKCLTKSWPQACSSFDKKLRHDFQQINGGKVDTFTLKSSLANVSFLVVHLCVLFFSREKKRLAIQFLTFLCPKSLGSWREREQNLLFQNERFLNIFYSSYLRTRTDFQKAPSVYFQFTLLINCRHELPFWEQSNTDCFFKLS